MLKRQRTFNVVIDDLDLIANMDIFHFRLDTLLSVIDHRTRRAATSTNTALLRGLATVMAQGREIFHTFDRILLFKGRVEFLTRAELVSHHKNDGSTHGEHVLRRRGLYTKREDVQKTGPNSGGVIGPGIHALCHFSFQEK
jgi:hypothetical protein